MFGKKSNVTNQLKLKEELLKEINLTVYKFETGKYNKALNADSMNALLQDIRAVYQRLKNSFGNGESDISAGCKKVREDLKELNRVSNDNLIGRFEDCAIALMADMEEIIDLEAEVISEISAETDSVSKKQRTFIQKLQEVSTIEQGFINNRNRVEDEIAKIERDKKELDGRLLQESNPRLKQNIFRQIQSTLNKIATMQVKSSQYSSCYNLLNSIKIYASELVAAGDLSNIELDKATVILNINRLRYVLDDPNKLEPLLNSIAADLKKSQNAVKTIDSISNKTFNFDEESYEAMNAYQNNLIKNQNEKEDIASSVSDLEEYLKKLGN